MILAAITNLWHVQGALSIRNGLFKTVLGTDVLSFPRVIIRDFTNISQITQSNLIPDKFNYNRNIEI